LWNSRAAAAPPATQRWKLREMAYAQLGLALSGRRPWTPGWRAVCARLAFRRDTFAELE